jgi:thioredoxin reductase
MEIYDVIIVGGGPAGLNAAVVLGRCRRKVLLFDSATYRNRYSHGMHNYLTRDDIAPNEFIKLCHNEIDKYGVHYQQKKVVEARKNDDKIFVVRDEDGAKYYSRKMLIATGLTDKLPEVEGFKELYGKSVFHCPYCDGWEARDKKIGVYARNKEGWELALALKGWSKHVTLFTDGRKNVKPYQQQQLDANNIQVDTRPFARISGNDGKLEKVIFKSGEELACEAIFFVNGFTQQCGLAETFGCEMTQKGVAKANTHQQTNISGLYVAGDVARDMHFVVVAAAEGAKAGVTINKELQKEITDKAAKQLHREVAQ